MRQILQNRKFHYGLAGLASSLVLYGFGLGVVVPVFHEYQNSFAAKEFQQHGVLGTYQRRFFSTWGKLKELQDIDLENQRLQSKVATLEKDQTLYQSSEHAHQAEVLTEKVKHQLHQQGGSELARTSSGIQYEVPNHLLGHQLHVLAVGYFRKADFEKSAMIFAHILDAKNETRFRSAHNYLMCGISWYKIKNFKRSEACLAHALELSEPGSGLQRKTLLWKSFIAQSTGHKKEAQHILDAMIAKFPHSEEVRWVNGHGRFADRTPARQEVNPNFALQHRTPSEVELHHDKPEEKANVKKIEHLEVEHTKKPHDEHHGEHHED